MKEQAKPSGWIPSLDGLRAVALMAVVAAHEQWPNQATRYVIRHDFTLLASLFRVDLGDLGVSLFFVLSGFLITTLITRDQDRLNFSLKRFYWRRTFRIFPVYYLYLFVITAASITGVINLPEAAFWPAVSYVSNYYPYRLSQPGGQGWLTGHTWSLSLEEQFYLAWPLILRWSKRRAALIIAVCLFLLAPLLRVFSFASNSYGYGDQASRLFHTRLDTLMAGCILAIITTHHRSRLTVNRLIDQTATLPVTLILLYCVMLLNAQVQAFRISAGLTAEAVLLAVSLLWTVHNSTSFIGKVLNCRVARHLGTISYSLYLWQQVYTGRFNPLLRLHSVMLDLIALFITAEMSYVLIEAPGIRLGRSYGRR